MSTDWPWSISFIGPGDITDKVDIIENMELVNRTCSSDCNPKCDYTWINITGNNIISNKSTLNLDTPDRYDTGNYTCRSSNIHGVKDKVFVLAVKCELSINYISTC